MLKLAGELIEGQLADHLADLDAHTRNVLEELRTGEYHASPIVSHVTGSPSSITADQLYLMAYPILRATTWDRIAINVLTADAGKKARLGIYNNGTNLYPGSLILDAGEIDVGSTGDKAIVINQSLAKGMYWVALISDGTPNFYAIAYHLDVLGSVSPGRQRATWKKAQAYGALPDPFPAGAGSDNYYWRVAMRLASLD